MCLGWRVGRCLFGTQEELENFFSDRVSGTGAPPKMPPLHVITVSSSLWHPQLLRSGCSPHGGNANLLAGGSGVGGRSTKTHP